MCDLKCNIFIEKNNLDLFKINISNLSNNDSKLENEINYYLNLFNLLLNECFTKTKCFQDTQYKNVIDEIKSEYNKELNKVNQELILKGDEINDSKLENEINSYLNLFNLLLNECFTKTKCFQDTQYKNVIDEIKSEYNKELNKVNQELILKGDEINE